MTPKLVDLSIDFDFFVREDYAWDWGHSEGRNGFFLQMMWDIRYSSTPFNIFDAVDPKEWADVMPNHEFFHKLITDKGLRIERGARYNKRRYGIAESHQTAYNFFRKSKIPADIVINFDAHHDVYKPATEPLDCGNWVSHLHRDWPTTQFWQVYPQWQDISTQWDNRMEKECDVPLKVTNWEMLRLPPDCTLRNLFICRSGAWTPPHLDDAFLAFVRTAHLFAPRLRMLDDIIIRKASTYEQHQVSVEKCKKDMEDLRELNRGLLKKASV